MEYTDTRTGEKSPAKIDKEEEPLTMGTMAIVTRNNERIPGVIVGKATNGVGELYIIRCVDGTLPNDVYKYDTFIAHLYEIQTWRNHEYNR